MCIAAHVVCLLLTLLLYDVDIYATVVADVCSAVLVFQLMLVCQHVLLRVGR